MLRVYKIQKIIKKKQIDVLFCVTTHQNLVSHFPFYNCKKIVSCRDTGNLMRNHSLFHKMLTRANLMVFNSYFMADYYLERYPEDEQKTIVVNNIVQAEKISELSSELVEDKFIEFTNSHFTVVAVGRLCREKGFNNLLRSFELFREKNSEAGLVLIGDGYLSEELKNMADLSKYRKDIIFLGFQSNPYKYMAKCDVFALSSITEGFPNVLIEAMACGLPVVATDCKSGPNEILNERFNYKINLNSLLLADYGILTPAINESENYELRDYSLEEKEFANALEVLSEDKELRNYYAEKSTDRCYVYSEEVIKRDLIEFIDHLN